MATEEVLWVSSFCDLRIITNLSAPNQLIVVQDFLHIPRGVKALRA